MATTKIPKINSALAFQFLYVEDCGIDISGRGEGHCPHCGAEGRWIYHWAEFGKIRGAMAGCFKALIGKIDKDDYTEFMIQLAAKQARNKLLNGWDKTVVRMLAFMEQGKYSAEWCKQKIKEAIADKKRFCAQKWGGH